MIATREMIEDSLKPRQQRFVELYVSGVPAGRAYEQAGYASRGGAADAEASRLVRNPKVAEVIRREREQARDKTLLTRDGKLAILAEIALSVTAQGRDRIAAIRLHNEMTGETSAPTTVQTTTNETWIERIRERARDIASPMARHALTEASQSEAPEA